MQIIIDIETLPAIGWTYEEKREHARRKAPANHKKPDSIEKWVDENADEEYRRTALDYRHGYIACVCLLPKVGDPITMATTARPGATAAEMLAAEAVVLRGVAAGLGAEKMRSRVEFLGWNNAGFDMPWLYHAALRAGLVPLANLIMPSGLGKYKLPWLDLMERWGCFQYGARSKQKHVAEYLGIQEPSPDIDGSMVYDQWSAGGTEYVEHCESDVITLREIALRMGALL